MQDLKISSVDKGHCLASWRNVFIQIWRSDVSYERNLKMRAEAQRFLSNTQGPVGGLILIESKCPLPDDKARQEAVGFLKDLSERGKGVCLVFEGTGFLAAASRAVMVTMANLSRTAYPYKVVSTLAEGDAFLHPLLPGSWSEGELATSVEAARARITEAANLSAPA